MLPTDAKRVQPDRGGVMAPIGAKPRNSYPLRVVSLLEPRQFFAEEDALRRLRVQSNGRSTGDTLC